MIKKENALWIGFLIVILLIASWKWVLPRKSSVTFEEAPVGEIVVYITGAVSEPGLLHLPLTARLNDAILEAGLLPEADIDVLNPAQKLKDGQKIVIPYKPTSSPLSQGQNGEFVQHNGKDTQEGSQTPINALGSIDSQGRININTAGMTELDKLPGVGPATAQKIIDYRTEHGFFQSPEDLKNVSGIGDKTYEKMASMVTVGP